MISALLMTAAMATALLTEPPVVESTNMTVEHIKSVIVDKVVLHETYVIYVSPSGQDSYNRLVLRQFIFYGTDGKVIETLNDSSGKHKAIRTNGEWWIIFKICDRFCIARTSKYEYINTITS